MPIESLAAVGSVTPVTATGYLDRAGSTGRAAGETAGADGGAGFGTQLAGAVDELRALQSTSNELAVQAVTGDLDDIHRATLASTRAQVTFELVAAVRNKGVEAFNDIMRMQA